MGHMPVAHTNEIVIPVGALSVRMSAPLAAEEIPDRITFLVGDHVCCGGACAPSGVFGKSLGRIGTWSSAAEQGSRE